MRYPPALGRIWLSLAFLAAGIVHGYVRAQIGGWLFVAGAGAVGLALRRRATLRIIALAALAFSLGVVAAAPRAPSGRTALEVIAARVPRCSFDGRVLEQLGGLGTLFALENLACSGAAPVQDAGVVAVEGSEGVPGAPVSGEGWLLPLGQKEFDSARRRAGALAALDPIAMRFEGVRVGPLAAAEAVRSGLRRATRDMDRERGALLSGLTLGDTTLLDRATIERFRRAGLSHLVAVSGSNVAIVLGALALLASRWSLKVRVIFCAAGLGMFVLVVGPDPSVVRAAVMGALGLVALLLGRRTESLHVLGLALLVSFAFRPALVFSVGLHLSAAATAGLVLWTRPLAERIGALPAFLAVPFAATVAAQLAVAPIVVGVFGQLSLSGPLANLLALPAVPPATILGMAAAVVDLASPSAAAVLAQAAEPCVAWILFVADELGAPTWAAVELPRWVGLALALPVGIAAARALPRQGSE